MRNPYPIYQEDDEKLVMIQGYVKSVTPHPTYNSVSFKKDSDDTGAECELISVMCFENKRGLNYKKLVQNTKGRFLTIVAVARSYNGKTSYVARAVSIAPKEFNPATNPIEKDETQPVYDTTPEEPKHEQLTLNGWDLQDEIIPFIND